MRAGCRCENMVFFVCWSRSESGAPCVRGVHSSNKHCVAVYCPISTGFSVFFFNKGLLIQTHYLFRIPVARWRHTFREIAVENCKTYTGWIVVVLWFFSMASDGATTECQI